MKVALFATCLGDQFFADACADSVRLLRHVGAEVSFPEGQTCCGQPAYNSGHRSEAVRLMEHTVDVFSGADYVVLPSGSCAGMLRTVYPGLATLGSLRVATEALAARTYELSQFLVEVVGCGPAGGWLERVSDCVPSWLSRSARAGRHVGAIEPTARGWGRRRVVDS